MEKRGLDFLNISAVLEEGLERHDISVHILWSLNIRDIGHTKQLGFIIFLAVGFSCAIASVLSDKLLACNGG